MIYAQYFVISAIYKKILWCYNDSHMVIDKFFQLYTMRGFGDDLNKIFNTISSSISDEYNWMFFWLYSYIFGKVHWLCKKRRFRKYINKPEVKNSFIDVL